jgi:phenylacetate-CoA ligase
MEWLIRNSIQIFAPLVYKAAHLDVFGKHKWLVATSKWSEQQRSEWKLMRLNEILEFTWNHVPFYKEYWGDHGIKNHKLEALNELGMYPILTKDIFRKNSTRIFPDNLKTIRCREWHTGGTTGQPVHYKRDMEHWTFAEAFHLWGWNQLGYVYGDPVGVIAGGSLLPERKTLEGRVRSLLQRRMFLYGVAMDKTIARGYWEKLSAYKVKFLYGYPSILYLFGKHLQEQGLALPKLKAVVTTAEMLQPQYRKGIENTLKCPVYNNLGCNDGGFESYECSRHNGLHYNDLQAILETDTVSRKEEGRLIITNLWNKSTPFIRYENGDLVSLEERECPCGSAFPMIGSIQGRTADILNFSNGQSLAGPALTLIFGAMEIDGWQVVQTSGKSLEIRICTGTEIQRKDAEHISKVLRRYISDDIQLRIKRVDKLETTKAGKLKPIWSELA